MTEDLGRYPGSRVERRAQVPAQSSPPAVEADAWDAKPVIKVLRGQTHELFPVGALAAALGRSAVTARLWERNGVLPRATYRLQNKNGVGGRRYYTRAQIEAVIRIAGEFHMLGEQRRIHPDFAERVADAWRELQRRPA